MKKRNDVKQKSFFLVSILLTLVLIYLFYEDLTKTICYQVEKFDTDSKRNDYNINNIDERNKISEWVENFNKIAIKSGSDKVTTHHYEHLYGRFLGPLRYSEINFLEIGLGCDTPYGPGKSIILWKEFLTKAKISILEYDGDCAKKFTNQVNNLFIGDQSNFDVLNNVAKYGPYDVIIDDGGHRRKQQINSLIGLWPYVKPNGYYIIEDIFTSFVPLYNDNPETAIDILFQLIVLLNEYKGINEETQLPNNIPISENARNIAKDLLFVSCFQRVCILNKK